MLRVNLKSNLVTRMYKPIWQENFNHMLIDLDKTRIFSLSPPHPQIMPSFKIKGTKFESPSNHAGKGEDAWFLTLRNFIFNNLFSTK